MFHKPGLADQSLRQHAAEAISNGLRKGGQYKIIFVVTEQMGRVLKQDSTTMKLVHEAAPEIKMNYGIIVNMISKGNYQRYSLPLTRDYYKTERRALLSNFPFTIGKYHTEQF